MALISGASGGIGRACAELLARRGYDLVLVARSAQPMEELATALHAAHGTTVTVLTQDLTALDGARRVHDALTAANIAVTLLVNNAGFGALGNVADLSLEEQTDMIDLNVRSLTALTRLLLPGMLQRRQGRILNVASTAAFQPGPRLAVYYASKAYVLSFSLALSAETAGTGVTVTCLCPGPTATGFGARARMQSTRLFRTGLMDATTVAHIGIDACLRGRPLVTAGWKNKLGAFCTRLIPRMTAARIARWVQS